MALSRARYDDVVIPYARRTSILEDFALQDLFSEDSPRRGSLLSNRESFRKHRFSYAAAPQVIPENEVFDEDEKKAGLEDEEFVQDDFEDLPSPKESGPAARISIAFRRCLRTTLKKHRVGLRIFVLLLLAVLYLAYFGYAMSVERLQNSASVRLLWVTAAVFFFVIVYFIKRWQGEAIDTKRKSIADACSEFNKAKNGRPQRILVGSMVLLVIATIVVILVLLVGMKNPYNLISLSGIIVLLLIGYMGSTHPHRIVWRPVLSGLLLQFILALLILKTAPGYSVFKFIGDRVTEFLSHTNAGTKLVFDTNELKLDNFAFRVLPIIIFFSTFISVLYYLGVMQIVIAKISWVMQATMGTTAGESLNAAGNIFVGMTEAPLIIRPFIGRMTNSELHAVMTGGFATIAGSVLGAYIRFGVPANHLISASVMSAPAALAMAKLFHPETKKSKTKPSDIKTLEKSPYNNLVEAAAGGALASIQLVANIAASLIAFLAILEFVNATLTWFGERAGMQEDLTFQWLCSYLLWPLAAMMGVWPADCRRVGELIGVKTFLNEYIAYTNLASIIKNRKLFDQMTKMQNITNPSLSYSGMDIIVPALNQTFKGGFFQSYRSEVITTYSLCGFANVGSLGIMLGGLSALAPHRIKDLSSIVFRAMIAGNMACFLTACIAGLLYDPELRRS